MEKQKASNGKNGSVRDALKILNPNPVDEFGVPIPSAAEAKAAKLKAESAHHDGIIKHLGVNNLSESPFNARGGFGDIEELAASIDQLGMLQPIRVRSVGKLKWEIVFGHRRFRAAKKLGLLRVPCEIVELEDHQVVEEQLVENSQRKDVTALEEATSYDRLHREHRYTVEQIAQRVGKSRNWVYDRMRLLGLAPEARHAFVEGRLPLTVALTLALRDHRSQAKDLAIVAPKGKDGPSTRVALDYLREKSTRSLKGTPFDQKNKHLHPAGVGACGPCPKRSSFAPGLFDDLGKGHDFCLDSKCFDAKKKATWEKASAPNKELGHTVLSIAAGEAIFKGGDKDLPENSKYVLANKNIPGDPKKLRTWADLADIDPKDYFVAPDAKLRPRALLLKAPLLPLLKEHGIDIEKPLETPFGVDQTLAREGRGEVVSRLAEVATERFRQPDVVTALELPELRMIALAFDSLHQPSAATHVRWDIKDEEDFESWIRTTATATQLQGFLVDVALDAAHEGSWNDFTQEVKAMAKRHGFQLEVAR